MDSTPTAIPLIVGITGHRDLLPDDIPQLKTLVEEVFISLRKQYPRTPLVLLSPLVEGADQLAAEVAREHDVRLVALLSWPRDFEPAKLARGGNLFQFRESLSRADEIIALPLEQDDLNLAAVDWSEFEARRFSAVGRYIARHSQLLIALWDGVPSQSSGTARVMAWQKAGAPAPFSAQLGELDRVEGAPICHILTRRISTAATGSSNGPTSTYVYPDSAHGNSADEFHGAWSHIDRFNRDVADLRSWSPQSIANSRDWVLPADVASQLTPAMRELFGYYALADAASVAFQNRMKPLVRSLFFVGPAALICLEVYAHLWSEWPVLVGYLALLGWGYWRFTVARHGEWEGRHLDYRALAEGLRVQFFWRWAGLSDCAADHYLRHLRGDLGWIRQASRTCFLLTGESQPGTGELSPGSTSAMEAISRHWIQDQLKYFAKNAPRNEHRETLCERIARWSFRAALLIAVIELAVHWKTHHANHLLIVMTFLGLVLAALAEEIADYHTYGILARQYEWMKNLFTTARDRLETHLAEPNPARAQRLIHEVGLEALNENADWLVQRRRKPMQLPKG